MDTIISMPWCDILQWYDEYGHFHEAPLEDVKSYGKQAFEEDDLYAIVHADDDDGAWMTLAGLCESRRYNNWWLRDQEVL